MKAFYVFLAVAVIVASVAAFEEEEDTDFFDLLEKRSMDDDFLEELAYGSEPMVKRGRFKHCLNARGDNCVCDRKFRKSNRRRFVNCVPKNMGTPV